MRKQWSEDSIREASKSCGSKGEFSEEFPGAYKAAKRLGILDDLFTNLREVWSYERVVAEAKKYRNLAELQRECKSAYAHAHRNGYSRSLYEDYPRSWTHESVIEEAKRYDGKYAFWKGSGGAYNYANRHNLLDTLFDNKQATWEEVSVALEAAKYTSLKEFSLKNGAAYQAALRFGVVRDVLKSKTGSRDVIYLWRAKNAGIYKVGVTSRELGTQRIASSAKAAGVAAEIVAMATVGADRARALEAAIKSTGQRATFDRKFGGHTEFRVFSDEEVTWAVALIEKTAKGEDA